MRYWIAILCLVITSTGLGQKAETIPPMDTASKSVIDAIENIPSRSLDFIDKKYSRLSNDVQKQSEKLLRRMQDKEAKLQKKLQGIDSLKAKELFETSKAKYEVLQNKIVLPVNTATAKLKEFIPGLDSTNTALKFLSQANDLPGIASDKLTQLSSVTNSIQELQGRLQQANEIQSFIREREAQLKETLANTGLGKELLGLNREVYYYQERLKEYKELLNDKKKLEEKLLVTVRELPAFQKLMQQNSYLAQFFRMPGTTASSAAITGLQTRTQISLQLSQTFSGPNVNPQQYLQQQVQAAKSEMDKLKNKLNQFGGGGSSDMTMPDFNPNNQKTKSFLQRLEYGINIQNQRSSNFLPAVSDIAFTLGYKINSNKTIGVGGSYKMGWGSGWNNIRFSSEGIGLRSYADIKIPSPARGVGGGLWITGGFEYNYLQAFNDFAAIKNLDVWQRSALAGLTKKYKIGKKREGEFQLLYDFLANRQVPQGQALKFRIGYKF
jgi:hypothetical protein